MQGPRRLGSCKSFSGTAPSRSHRLLLAAHCGSHCRVQPESNKFREMRFPRLAFAGLALLLSIILFFRVMSGVQRQPRRVQEDSRCQTWRTPGPPMNEPNYSTPESLQSALSTVAKDLRQWRERPHASTRPSIDHVERFIANRAAHARLSAARFALDLELAALQRGDLEPAKTPVDAVQMPPRHEADVGLPEPATFLCRMLPDGFEVCEYENVCADLPSPALGVGQGYASQTDGIYFVGSDIVPSYARSRAGNWPRDREAVAAEAPTECRNVAAAAGRGESWVDGETQGGLPSPRCLRWLRHFLRLYPRPGTSVPWRVDMPDDQGFDSVFEDIPEGVAYDYSRLLPFSPNETLSVAHGGSFPGVVTWVDNLYLARDVLEAHLWGWAQTVSVPVLSTHWANMSANWKLPPMDNLLVYGTPAWKRPQLKYSAASPWYPGASGHHIRGGELPWRGPELHSILPANSTVVESYPWLDALVAALRNASEERNEPGDPPAIAGHVPLPIAIPYEMAILAHPPGTGTRMIFSIADVPLPPDVAELDRNGPLGGVNLTIAVPGGQSAHMHTGRRRICGRRMVALGQKPLLVGGVAEGSAFRNFASRQLKVPKPARDANSLPRRHATIINRNDGDISARSFANLPAMLGILRKYNVSYNIVTDAELERMSFSQQAAAFSSFSLFIVAHGAGLSNAFAIPSRASVLEIYPRGMWCDIYKQMLRAQGAHVFPIYSTLLGPKVRFDYHLATQGPVALSQECEANALAQNAHEGYCWMEYRKGSVVTPLVEFEHALLAALMSVGLPTPPLDSPMAMIDGFAKVDAEQCDTDDCGSRESNRWILCPPPALVLAAGARMGIGAYRCMYPNGTWLSGLPGIPT